MKWEYLVVLSSNNYDEQRRMLKKHADEGWHLIGPPVNFVFYFERRARP